MSIASINNVVQRQMCLGCGACSYICPSQKISLFDYLNVGIRPVADDARCGDCQQCLDVCPAVQSDFKFTEPSRPDIPAGFVKEWGPVVAIWEGWAADPEIRYRGSSGGALTALSAYCLEKAGMHGVLHIAQDADDPVRNRTRLSRRREDLMQAAGSRYSPASVCNGLALVEGASAPCAIIGKPSEIAAVKNARRLRPELDRNVGVTMSFFCAETPSTQGTLSLLENLGFDSRFLGDLRYRGFGWPGHFAPTRQGRHEPDTKMTYRESWAYLQAFRPWSVQLWPDGSGELADISCGDPWYESPDGVNPGSSLVVARTARGRAIVEGAIAAGYLVLTPAEPWKVAKSQPGLLTKKGAVWGRRIALRLFGLPVTRLDGLDLWHCWKPLALQEKLRATLGTVRRIIARKIYRPLRLNPEQATVVKPAFQTTGTANPDGTPR